MTHAEYLEAELKTAQEAYEATLHTSNISANYWTGYIEAINNALHNYNGQGE